MREHSHPGTRAHRPDAGQGRAARRLAIDLLERISAGGAYANLALGPALERSQLGSADRRLVTELVYGTCKMQRACDWLLEPFLDREVEPRVRAALRVGTYQIGFMRTPPYAAVDATAGASPRRARGLVNAVLRRLADADLPDPELPEGWPSVGVRLSYPDWIVEELGRTLGSDRAIGALEQMNRPGTVDPRPDGYVQDRASRWVAELLGVRRGETVADLCAAPGGKATLAAAGAALVAASDLRAHRAGLLAENARRLGCRNVAVLVADATRPPYRCDTFDRVLVDAPCSGLGVLGRRPDARWRITPADATRLAGLQRRLISSALELARPGGIVLYSVCTLTAEETRGIDEWVGARHPDLIVLPPPRGPWEPAGRGALLLPQAEGTDGMYVFRVQVPAR